MSVNNPVPFSGRVAQVYLRESSFRHRGEPLERNAPTPGAQESLKVGIGFVILNDGKAAEVRVSVSTDPDANESRYIFSAEMSVVFELDKAYPHVQIAETGVTMLYPFLREYVANMTHRGRFGPVYLNPFNVRKALEGGLQPIAD